MAGRGEGKTRRGSETSRMWSTESKNWFGVDPSECRGALVGRTAGEVRDTMIEGESGILAVCPPWNTPKYEPSKRRLTWPSGAMATTYTADEPDQLRGPQHHWAWGDEVATWKYTETYDNLQMGLRLGTHPRQIFTTTPRPVSLIRNMIEKWKVGDPNIQVTTGSSFANKSNLTDRFFSEVIAPYLGTERGRQEIYGELLEEAAGALWTREQIDILRVTEAPETMKRIVIGVDPAGGGGDEIGIVAAGLGGDDHWYVLADVSLRAKPEAWAKKVTDLYHLVKADYIAAETNYGGDMVQSTLRVADRFVSVRPVTATRGKALRAQPISLAYSQGLVHHVGTFNRLEDQMVNWVPEEKNQDSPDRLDALVWALTALKAGQKPASLLSALKGL